MLNAGTRKLRILVAHPGLQHSHQLALALEEAGILMGYWSGVPVAAGREDRPWWLPARLRSKVRSVNIAKCRRRNLLWVQVLLHALKVVSPSAWSSHINHRIFHLFDYWLARELRKLKPDVVVAYENSAYHTFRVAKSLGIRCVLDAASMHHALADQLASAPQTEFRKLVNRRKDAEIELADMILTCSSMAANSYRDNGVDASKIIALPLGADLPDGFIRHASPRTGKPKFVFAGNLRWLKSVDVILDAFARLHAEGYVYDLLFVGGVSEARWVEELRNHPTARHTPSVPQSELFAVLESSDCLLLPSRFDSFGMVVAEALSCGTPVIVSSNTGAKEIVEACPGSGWIVEPTVDSLYNLVKYLLDNPSTLQLARAAARAASLEFTWVAYRLRAAQLFERKAEDWR